MPECLIIIEIYSAPFCAEKDPRGVVHKAERDGIELKASKNVLRQQSGGAVEYVLYTLENWENEEQLYMKVSWFVP